MRLRCHRLLGVTLILCLHVQVEEVNTTVDQDAEDRTKEAENMHTVLRELELVLENRDLMAEARRRAFMESQVRRVIFRIGQRAMARGMSAWKEMWKHNKRIRFLVYRSLSFWRRARLAHVFGPWARWAVYQQRQKHEAAMQNLDDVVNSDLEQKFMEIQERTDELLGDELVDKIDRRIQANNEDITEQIKEIEEDVRLAKEESAAADSNANSAHERIDNEIITWLEAQRQAQIDSGVRKLVMRNLITALKRSFDAWYEYHLRYKRLSHIMSKAVNMLRQRWLTRCLHAWMGYHRWMKDQGWGERIKEVKQELQSHAENLSPGLSPEQLEELQQLFGEQMESMLEPISEMIEENQENVENLRHILVGEEPDAEEKEITAEETVGLLTDLRNRVQIMEEKPENEYGPEQRQQERRARIEAAMRVRLFGYRSKRLAKAFLQWKADYLAQKDHLGQVLKSINFWNKGCSASCFEIWKRSTLRNKQQKIDDAQKALEKKMEDMIGTKVEEAHETIAETQRDQVETKDAMQDFKEDLRVIQLQMTTHTENVSSTKRDKDDLWRKRTLNKMLSRLMHKFLGRAFDGWRAKVAHKLRTANLKTKVLWRMENVNMARAFDPWLIKARRALKEEQEARVNQIDEYARSLAERIGDTIDQIGDLEKAKDTSTNGMASEFFGEDDDETEKPLEVGSEAWAEQLQEQIAQQLAEGGGSGGGISDEKMAEFMAAVSERLEHLEVTLREDFQHVEVRCDLLGRQFAVMKGKGWGAGTRHPGSVPSSPRAGATGSFDGDVMETNARVEELAASVQELRKKLMHGASVSRSSSSAVVDGQSAAYLGEEIEELRSKLGELKKVKETLVDVTDDLSAVTRRVTKLEQGSDGVELGALVKDVQSLQVSVETGTALATQTTTAVDKLNDLCGANNERVSKLEVTVESVQQSHAKLVAAGEALRKEVNSAANQHQQTGAELARLKDDLTRYGDDAKSIRDHALDLPRAAEFDGLKTEVGGVRTSVQELTTSLAKVFELRADVNALNKSVEAGQSQWVQLPQVIADVGALRETGKQVADLSDSLESQVKRMEEIEGLVGDSQAEKRALGDHLTQLAEKLDRLHATVPASAERQLPGRAAASGGPKSAEFSTVSRRVTQLKMDREKLRREGGQEERLRETERELAQLQAKLDKIFDEEDVAASPARRSAGRTSSAAREQAWKRAQGGRGSTPPRGA